MMENGVTVGVPGWGQYVPRDPPCIGRPATRKVEMMGSWTSHRTRRCAPPSPLPKGRRFCVKPFTLGPEGVVRWSSRPGTWGIRPDREENGTVSASRWRSNAATPPLPAPGDEPRAVVVGLKQTVTKTGDHAPLDARVRPTVSRLAEPHNHGAITRCSASWEDFVEID
jgi:hypothetical protein